MNRTIQLRYLDGDSFLHRMRSDAKILALVVCSMAIALNPGWAPLGVGWAFIALVFVLARLPVGLLAPPPRLLLAILGFSFFFSLLSGGDPAIGGLEVGGVLELAQLVTFGFLLIAFAAVIAWTTTLTDVGLGLTRLLRPLRFLGVPVDDLATVIVLAVRSLPIVRAELMVTIDARRTRPRRPEAKQGAKAALADAVDVGATVVVGAHRRARDMARAMVGRASATAPPPDPIGIHGRDVLAVGIAAAAAASVFVWF